MKKMSSCIKSVDTHCKALSTVQAIQSRNLVSQSNVVSSKSDYEFTPKKPPLTAAITGLLESYNGFPLDRMFGLENEFSLTHFQYVDFMVGWIEINKPAQYIVETIWQTFRHQNLHPEYLKKIIPKIMPNDAKSKIDLPPKLYYKYLSLTRQIVSVNQLVPNCTILFESVCKNCSKQVHLKVNFADKTPCVDAEIGETSHCQAEVEHVFMCYHDGSFRVQRFLSLLTNNLDGLTQKITNLFKYSDKSEAFVVCLYKCLTKQ